MPLRPWRAALSKQGIPQWSVFVPSRSSAAGSSIMESGNWSYSLLYIIRGRDNLTGQQHMIRASEVQKD